MFNRLAVRVWLNLMKKIVPYLITAAIAVVAVKVLYPMIQPLLSKTPLVGKFFAA